MRKKLLVVAAAMLIMLMAVGTSFGQSITYQVGVQIKNLDNSNAAAITVTYYDQSSGNQAGTLNQSIAAGDSFTMATLQGVSTGFNGSAVVSSDRQIAAIANVFGNGFSGMGASYNAFSAGDTTVSLPLLFKSASGFTTWFNVQNTGNSPANVTVTYSNGATETQTINSGAAKTFDQANASGLPAGFVGSAIVTSDQPIVATVLQQGATTLLGYDGFPSSAASTAPVFPLVNANNGGFVTGIQIQNTGTQDSSVTVSYTAGSSGSNCTETQNVPGNGGSATFAFNAFTSSGSCGDATFVGSGVVTSNSASQPLVAIVNQLNISTNKGASYGAFNPSSGTSTMVAPLVMDRNGGFFTGMSIANVGTQATTVTCSYTNNGHTDSATLQPGEALTPLNLNALADGYVGAATCTASGGDASVVGIVNELNLGASSDSFLVYEGTNQ